MKKIVFFILMFLFFINTIYALEECTPSEEYLKYMALSDEEKVNYIEPAYCKELMEKKESENELVLLFESIINSIAASVTDSYYNAADDGLLSPSENQGNLGTCWSFSSISSVEANARKNGIGSYNFSESHMIYSVLGAGYSDEAGKFGKYKTSNFDGGKVTYAASYYFNAGGQLLESEMPYSPTYTKINSSQYKQGRKIISLGGFSLANIGNYSACTTDEITYIKNQITTYGSVQVSMYMDEYLFKDINKNYYVSTTSNSTLPNHGVSIVGWDDSISGSNFGVSRNGAFIIKNSWGPTWSNDGLFYISYEDSFVCKNIASFFDVSTTTYDNTYNSADVLGVPTFTFGGTFYMSAKFELKSSSETLKRVSFPVGENSRYSVYLVTDNNLKNQSSWQLLTSGNSSVYGIRSINLNKTLYDDFTIVTKYETSSSSSVFTMCTNIDDTSNMTISTLKNYYSVNGSSWADMNSVNVGSVSISCEPNIYAYTNNIASSTGSISINSISASGNKYIVSFTNNGVPTNNISYAVYSNNNNVTSSFTITPNYSNSTVSIESNGKISGNFIFYIRYDNKEVSTNFTLSETISSKNTSFVNISNTNIFVNITNNYTLTYSSLLSALDIKNTEISVLNASGNTITSTSSVITTNCRLKLNNKTYLIVILGDVNCDGRITALDYIEIRKHIMGNTITNTGKVLASDMDQNNRITALDYISIRKILMR